MKLTVQEIVKAVNGQLTSPILDKLEIVGVSTDSRKIAQGELFIPLIGEQFDGHDYIEGVIEKGAVASFWDQSKAVPESLAIPLIMVNDTLEALQNLATYYRNKINPKVVGITGSNGKTTTKDLVASVVSTHYRVHKTMGNYNNHIGVPLTLLAMPEQTEVAIIEMGMSNRGEIALLTKIAQPDIAVITNIGESHIEYLGTRENISLAKLEILEGLAENGIVVLNGDEPLLRETKMDLTRFRVRWVGTKENNDLYPVAINPESTGVTFMDVNKNRYTLPLYGEHNVINALMAIEVGRQLLVPNEKIYTGLASPELTSMRLEKVMARNGCSVLNDAYNASPTSMKASLHLLMTFTQYKKKIAVLGDMFELGKEAEHYHQEIGKLCAALQVNLLITTGKHGRIIYDSALYNGMDKTLVHHFDNMEQIGSYILDHSDENTIVLIKASRGMHLEQVVNQLLS